MIGTGQARIGTGHARDRHGAEKSDTCVASKTGTKPRKGIHVLQQKEVSRK